MTISKTKKKEIDIAFFPYSSPSSIGSYLRISQHENVFKEKKIRYACFYCITDAEEQGMEHLSALKLYFLYAKIFFRRINAISKVKNAKVVFIQRSMFPYYINQQKPVLEKMLKKQGNFVVLDFWDSVWEKNKPLTDNTARVADLITVSNQYLYQYFIQLNQKVKLFNIAIDNTKYVKKNDYSVSGVLRLAYIGYPSNVGKFISLFEPIALELKKKIDFKLIIISNATFELSYSEAEYHPFNYTTFSEILASCDIGLYLVEESNISKGKSAMKVIDYLASGLPVVASPWGVHGFEDGKHLLFCENNDDFVKQIINLAENKDLRQNLAMNAQKIISEKFSVKESVKIFENICVESQE